MATTVHIPLALSAVGSSGAGAFWKLLDGTNHDRGCVAFRDQNVGIATYAGVVPQNLAGTPSWALRLHHSANSGAGTNVVVIVRAKDFANSDTVDVALTALHQNEVVAVNSAGVLTQTMLTGSSYDATEALVAGNLLLVEILRIGSHASESLGGDWNLEQVVLRVDVA